MSALPLTGDTRIGGVIFTGSTEVARLINKALSKRDDNPVLIAETGGQNAMIVDSTALPEQVCLDVLNSAFDSAGQRCSALRILCVQEDVADKMVNIIKGAMDELVVGKPTQLTTDIGPVIDAEAQQNLLAHINRMKGIAKAYHEVKTAADVDSNNSTFVRPILFELNNLNELQREVFGPVLHVIRYRASELDQLIDQINAKGYALTSGVHSRIEVLSNTSATALKPVTSTLTATSSVPLSAYNLSAVTACPVPVLKRVVHSICNAWFALLNGLRQPSAVSAKQMKTRSNVWKPWFTNCRLTQKRKKPQPQLWVTHASVPCAKPNRIGRPDRRTQLD